MRNILGPLGLIGFLCSVLLVQHSGETASHIKTVAITEIIAHQSLDESRKGIVDTLIAAGYVPGKTLHLIYENAQGNSQLATQIAHKLVSKSPDVLVPISTQSTQTIIRANRHHLPVVFATVTDPVSSGIVPDLQHEGMNVTGAMESPPIKKQLSLIKKILPRAKRIGVIYSASEMNSVTTVKRLKQLSHLPIIERAVNNSMDIKLAAQSLVHQVDALYLPSDNQVWSALDSVTKIAEQAGIPVITADPDSIHKGVVMALGYSQYDIGKTAGHMIVQILNGGSAAQLPIQKPPVVTLAINVCAANKISLNIPKSVLNQAQRTINPCSLIEHTS